MNNLDPERGREKVSERVGEKKQRRGENKEPLSERRIKR